MKSKEFENEISIGIRLEEKVYTFIQSKAIELDKSVELLINELITEGIAEWFNVIL